MPVKIVDSHAVGHREDWEDNTAAFACPICAKVFIVSELLHKGSRSCPSCGKSRAFVLGSKTAGGSARIEWEDVPEL